MSQQLNAQAQRLADWMKNDAIPLWLARGINPENGAHYERLLATGETDLQANVRVRVQARQAFFFTVAADRGWCSNGQEVARKLLSFVRKTAAHPSVGAGYTHLMDPTYRVIDNKQDLYDHAFFLLAYAWLYRVGGDADALAEAEKIVAHLDRHFGSACGGWIEGDYAYVCRRQNPHMHLFEAFLALYEATQNARWLARAAEIFSLFQTTFFDVQDQVLFEFFQDDWQLCSDNRGDIVEPGHMMEWVWLLDWYSRLSGRPVEEYTRALYTKGLAIGLAKSGLVFDAVSPEGHVLDPKKRCWGITELIKASLVMIRRGHPQAEAVAIKAVDDLFTYYLCTETPGSYVDQRGAFDEIVVDTAPASTLYHLVVACTELLDHCNGKYSSGK